VAQYANGVTWQFDKDAFIDDSPAPEYATAIAEVVGLDLSGPTTDLLDSTVHGDTWRKRVSGLKDGGTATITIRMETDDATHKTIRDNVGVHCAHKFTFPKKDSEASTAFAWENDAIIQSYSVTAPYDGLMEMTVNLQLSGPPTFTEEAD